MNSISGGIGSEGTDDSFGKTARMVLVVLLLSIVSLLLSLVAGAGAGSGSSSGSPVLLLALVLVLVVQRFAAVADVDSVVATTIGCAGCDVDIDVEQLKAKAARDNKFSAGLLPGS